MNRCQELSHLMLTLLLIPPFYRMGGRGFERQGGLPKVTWKWWNNSKATSKVKASQCSWLADEAKLLLPRSFTSGFSLTSISLIYYLKIFELNAQWFLLFGGKKHTTWYHVPDGHQRMWSHLYCNSGKIHPESTMPMHPHTPFNNQ